MDKKSSMGIIGVIGATLLISTQIPDRRDPIDKKREDVILSMNTLLQSQHIALTDKDQCVITIFGKRKKLEAILACDEIKVIEHALDIPSEVDYVTHIINIDALPDGTLDSSDGCFIMESGGYQIIDGPDCDIERRDFPEGQKSKPKFII